MKRAIAVVVSISILAAIFYKIDLRGLLNNLMHMERWYFALSISMFIPQFLVMARRWQVMIQDHCKITLWESMWLVLAGNTLNVVLPTKLGDFAKTVYHRNKYGLELKKGVFLTILEKSLDLASIGALILIGSLFIGEKNKIIYTSMLLAAITILSVIFLFTFDIRRLNLHRLLSRFKFGNKVAEFVNKWEEAKASQKANKLRLAKIVLFSIMLWVLHIGQIYLFFLALRSSVSPAVVLVLAPMSILVGLLPISFGGIGTRDAALIYLFAPYENATLMASVGLLSTLRYFIPALCGLPFLPRLGFKPSELESAKEVEVA